ncbi:TROVE domain-containing protein [Stenotrophomonas sp. YAU14D1_LEIMI4_1]|uniref:TROVE domain-containing protein n=1 Tax=Stenotrophomonas sp. YAU14D1_LEIMI4_1 TaxID=2072407 RepID=UPI000D53EE0A|nr:TROVE domain-containing protein [Stenotrophomonas sp. YAU14D1_LEIMI4_1]AWH27080.1 RNA-binding protein [Stenotrophomonas sp. YAU14D1_LEIMI4_1]
MANLMLFSNTRAPALPPATTVNEAGGLAYCRDARAALALYAATGCLNNTFYSNADAQLQQVLALTAQVEPAFVARTAVYARQVAHMKDMPALLLAVLSLGDPEVFAQVFPRVIDNGRQLRTFVQIMRSGQVGRRSLGSLPKRLVREWIKQAPVETLVRAAIGQQPSLADLIRMVHPKPADAERKALYAWIVGRPYDAAQLPALVQAYEAFKRDPQGLPPALPFQYFSTLPLDAAQWSALARSASWQSMRMNLNTFARNGVFDDAAMVDLIAARLRDPQQVRRSRVLPYQLLMAFHAGKGLPLPILDALQDAMEIATASVPVLPGRVVVAVDVSASMQWPLTGYRKGASTSVRCVDVAALIAACVLRGQPQATVLPFDTQVRPVRLNPRDSVMTLAAQLAINGGGTSVSAPLEDLNRRRAQVDLVVLVSDNESWRDTRQGGATATMRAWEVLKQRCPQARLVCIDLQPVASSQTVQREDVLHIGGFSDAVFDLLGQYAQAPADGSGWVQRIQDMTL